LIAQGENAQVNLQGVYAGKDIQWQAKVARGEGVIDNKSRMSYLVAEVSDPYGLKAGNDNPPLRYGSYVTAKIVGIEIANASIVPRYLVDNNKVAILDSESKLHYAKIDIVRQDGKNVIIADGLADGDKLIVSALDYPVDGMKLALATDESQLEEKELEVEQGETQMANNKESGE